MRYYNREYYDRVYDYEGTNFGWWMFGIPLTVLLVCFLLATGLWPLLMLYWLWPKGKK